MSAKPVYMRLMPNERRMLEELSETLNSSTSSVARSIYLEGIDFYIAKVSGSTTHKHAKIIAGG
nr:MULTISPECIES: hypothetical protein [unclassified Caballeronia]